IQASQLVVKIGVAKTGVTIDSVFQADPYRMKQLLGDSLTLHDYDGQVAEAMAMVRALNRMTKAGMPESVRIA
ncbi:hypothetical protein V5053_25585, partial [Enterobacter hormaechei]